MTKVILGKLYDYLSKLVKIIIRTKSLVSNHIFRGYGVKFYQSLCGNPVPVNFPQKVFSDKVKRSVLRDPILMG